MMDAKTIKNKSLNKSDLKTKEEDTSDTRLVSVFLKNNTYIDGVVYSEGLAYLTPEQYEKVKRFL